MQPQADPFIAPPCHHPIQILYQDDYLLVVNKPSGLLTLSGKNPLNKDSVHYRVVQLFPTATMLHRLDLGTSGLLIIVLNKQINAHITKQFQNRSIKKTYIALLQGYLKQDDGILDYPIAKGEFPLQKVCHEVGKPAQSHYQVIERFNCIESEKGTASQVTRVKFTPITGRTHQLRVHSQAFGHPILGCDLYANDKAYSMAKRLMLHAQSLEFVHPVTGKILVIEAVCDF